VRLLSDTKLAVVQHIDAIKCAQEVLGDGSRRLKRLVGEEDSYWSNVLGISGFSGAAKGDDEEMEEDGSPDAETTNGSAPCWALLPRPLGNGLAPNRQIATDVMIPYAPNEGESLQIAMGFYRSNLSSVAAAGFRALAMATMVQDESTTKESAQLPQSEIAYTARRHKRLRISIKSSSGEQTFSRVTGLADPTSREPIAVDISRAQAEMFDDEVFEAVSMG
jgi:hypothetical protein